MLEMVCAVLLFVPAATNRMPVLAPATDLADYDAGQGWLVEAVL